MSDPVISVEGLSKRYVIGHELRHDSLRDTLHHTARKLWRRLRWGTGFQTEEFWALRDVSFEVKQGEVVGIIGRNGAGKSTLLKILSRITEPTEGTVTIKGRVASLLEVGTGFHPELSGRENVFLNGAILGMSRAEIRRKFDEIVAFAEVEKFLDTPVKHYSSGMYVRLAFAVAAHLEPEILIVDEVLAVGDAEFQKRCLGRMHTIASQEGRTVLFVSHNMAAISSLTNRAMLLAGGRMVQFADTSETVSAFHASIQSATRETAIIGGGEHTTILSAHLLGAAGQEQPNYIPGETMNITVDVQKDETPGLSIELMLLDPNQQRVGIFSLFQFHGDSLPSEAGIYRCQFSIAGLWLAAGTYSFDVITSVANVKWDHCADRAITFDVHFSNPAKHSWDFRFDMGFGPIALRSARPPHLHLIARSPRGFPI